MQRVFEDLPVEMAEEGYPVDIDEADDQLIVDAELPGFSDARTVVALNSSNATGLADGGRLGAHEP